MRFANYLSYSGLDEKTNIFRSIKINLVDEPKDYSDILEHIKTVYGIDVLGEDLIDNINRELRKVYKGKFMFAYCLDEGVSLDQIKMSKRHLKRLKLLQLETGDKLSSFKRELERKAKK